MKKIMLLLMPLLICSCSSENKISKITCNEMKELIKEENSILIDVRTKEEYEENHLEDAINIPLDVIKEKIKDNEKINNNTNIIVYCKSGIRSSEAANILSKLEYKNIYDLGSINNCNK